MTRLGDSLVEARLVTAAQVEQALVEQRASGQRLGWVLVDRGLVEEAVITSVLGRQYQMPVVDLSSYEVDPETLRLVPAELAAKHGVLPLKRDGRTLTVATGDPASVGALDDLEFVTGCRVVPLVARESTVRAAIARAYQPGRSVTTKTGTELAELEAWAELERFREAPGASEATVAAKLLNAIVGEAAKWGIPEIQIEARQEDLGVWYRQKGTLHEVLKAPRNLHAALALRVKVLSDLDIAGAQLGQEGRLQWGVDSRSSHPRAGEEVVAFRVTISPAEVGEKIVFERVERSATEPTGAVARSAFGRPSVPESMRTLRCAKCEAMNPPAEWYCEQCGAELTIIPGAV
jgi:type IV pilus assembly protein PilB